MRSSKVLKCGSASVFYLLASVLYLSSASMPFCGGWERFMPPAVADARICSEFGLSLTNVKFAVDLPAGEHTALTVVAWLQVTQAPGMYLTTTGLWVADPVRLSNPDLLGGRGGFPTNTVLGGTLTVAGFGWQPYEPGINSNRWPKGVYTVAGWSTNQITVALGGTSMTLGPGPFNRNVAPAAGADCVIMGTGLACVGISRTPAAQWFQCLDGVRNEETGVLTRDSIVTNELAFCSWRLRFEGTNQLYRSDLARFGECGSLAMVQTNGLPASGRTTYSSEGMYQFGLAGLGSGTGAVRLDGFGARVVARWLTDEEICRVKANDEIEMARRGIPRWR
jgi:hypothetical protein